MWGPGAGWERVKGVQRYSTALLALLHACHVLQGPCLGVDFISHNAQAAKRAPRRHSRSLQILAQVLERQREAQEHYNTTQKGHVPH